MGAENRKLWKDLDVSEEMSCIQHPTDKRKKVNFFADVPHLSKLARNHWLDVRQWVVSTPWFAQQRATGDCLS